MARETPEARDVRLRQEFALLTESLVLNAELLAFVVNCPQAPASVRMEASKVLGKLDRMMAR